MTVVDRSARAAVATRGLVLVNRRSEYEPSEADEVRRAFADHDVEECDDFLVAARTHEAVREGRPFVGVASGDSTLRAVAEVVAQTPVALLPIPTGVHNHFARALGITSVADAALAAKRGHTELVDVARVEDRVFVNNSSVGAYPGLVAGRAPHDHRLPSPVANLLAAIEQLRAGKRVTVDIDGRTCAAWLVFVGNGAYGERLVDATSRENLRDGVLDVRIVRADYRFARVRLLLAALHGNLTESAAIERRTCRAITIGARRRSHIDVALDGEVESLPTPLRYEALPAALRVVVPEPRA